jgi:hypothetical protein
MIVRITDNLWTCGPCLLCTRAYPLLQKFEKGTCKVLTYRYEKRQLAEKVVLLCSLVFLFKIVSRFDYLYVSILL